MLNASVISTKLLEIIFATRKKKRYDDKIQVSFCEENIHGRNLASNQKSSNLLQQR
jgi:hypothetical protein